MVEATNTTDQAAPTADRSWTDRFSRHDLVLAAIPLVFAFAFTAYIAFAVPLIAAIGAGSLISCLLLADALYIHPPAPRTNEVATTTTAGPDIGPAQESGGNTPSVEPSSD